MTVPFSLKSEERIIFPLPLRQSSFLSLGNCSLSNTTSAYLNIVLDRLKILISMTEAVQKDASLDKAELNSVLQYIIRLLEFPAATEDKSEITKKIQRILKENEFRKRRKADYDKLTSREKEVLTLLAIGHQNKEIANRLCVSLETAKHYRKIIKSKLYITSTAEFVQYGQAFNLI